MKGDVTRFIAISAGQGEHRLRVFQEKDGEVTEGAFVRSDGYWYPITGGVPCFLRGSLRPDFREFQKKHGLPAIHEESGSDGGEDQLLTNVTFSDKWRRFRRYGLEASHQRFLFEWYCKKLGFSTVDELKGFYRSKALILEVGPGSGFNTKFMSESTEGQVFAVDISDAAFTAYENTKMLPNCHVFQGDLMDLPFQDGFFDFIIADGVLHHTPDTKEGLTSLYKKLKPGGWLFFYVYKKMGPMRQFCDHFLRNSLSKLEPEACYAACEALTDLGRELSRLGAKVTLEKPIPLLGIPSGTHDVQRLIYYNFLKCFWNDAFDYETNNMVNFDWYHPHTAWQHTEDEVREWLGELGVKEYQFNDANPNGISVLFRKP